MQRAFSEQIWDPLHSSMSTQISGASRSGEAAANVYPFLHWHCKIWNLKICRINFNSSPHKYHRQLERRLCFHHNLLFLPCKDLIHSWFQFCWRLKFELHFLANKSRVEFLRFLNFRWWDLHAVPRQRMDMFRSLSKHLQKKIIFLFVVATKDLHFGKLYTQFQTLPMRARPCEKKQMKLLPNPKPYIPRWNLPS